MLYTHVCGVWCCVVQVRGTDSDKRECLAHLQLFFSVTQQCAEETCAGTDTITQVEINTTNSKPHCRKFP